MVIIREARKLRRFLKSRCAGKSVGFVPTMGGLHEGHFTLVRRSRKENDFSVVSIFVNPIQFDRKSDYLRYARNERRDAEKARKEGVDLLFVPSETTLYPARFQTEVTVNGLSKNLCGLFRPGHFQGVATVVLKLLNLVRPRRVYFGMKDYQQYKVIEQMVEDLNLGVEVVPCPTVREPDGLAFSSRNKRLSSLERGRASKIFPALQRIADLIKSKRTVKKQVLFNCFQNGLNLKKTDRIEYLEIVDPETLTPLKTFQGPLLLATAVWVGKTRLIDNLLL